MARPLTNPRCARRRLVAQKSPESVASGGRREVRAKRQGWRRGLGGAHTWHGAWWRTANGRKFVAGAEQSPEIPEIHAVFRRAGRLGSELRRAVSQAPVEVSELSPVEACAFEEFTSIGGVGLRVRLPGDRPRACPRRVPGQRRGSGRGPRAAKVETLAIWNHSARRPEKVGRQQLTERVGGAPDPKAEFHTRNGNVPGTKNAACRSERRNPWS